MLHKLLMVFMLFAFSWLVKGTYISIVLLDFD
jgi:hypothetical protein